MFTGLVIMAAVGLLAVLSHRRTKIEEKIYKHISLQEWLYVFAFPIIMYLGWFFVVKNIIERPNIDLLPFADFDVLAIMILFMIYGFVGNTIHFTGKILWRYLAGFEHTMAFRVNEMFHGKLGHYLTYLNFLFICFLMPVLEINHPVIVPVTPFYLMFTIMIGVIFGLSAKKAIFFPNEWFGGYNKPLFFVVSVLLLFLLGLAKTYDLHVSLYPSYLFIASFFTTFLAAFVIGQVLIFSRLGHKRRLRFLAKILSA